MTSRVSRYYLYDTWSEGRGATALSRIICVVVAAGVNNNLLKIGHGSLPPGWIGWLDRLDRVGGTLRGLYFCLLAWLRKASSRRFTTRMRATRCRWVAHTWPRPQSFRFYYGIDTVEPRIWSCGTWIVRISFFIIKLLTKTSSPLYYIHGKFFDTQFSRFCVDAKLRLPTPTLSHPLRSSVLDPVLITSSSFIAFFISSSASL